MSKNEWRSISKLSVLSAAALFAMPFACSADKEPDAGGLMLIVAEDGSTQLDRITISIGNKGTTLRTDDVAVPRDVTLPTTLAIASNGDPAATVDIAVSAFRAGVPIDRRDLVVRNVPTERVAAVRIVLSARCSEKVTPEGTGAQSLCAPGTTCNPATTTCVPNELDGSRLPTYDGNDGAAGLDATPGPDSPSDDAGDAVADTGPGGLVTCTSVTEKRCDNKCVSVFDPAYGCGAPNCRTCDLDGTTVYTCAAGACSLATCLPGYKLCGNECVSINDPDYGCGSTTCNTAPCPPVPGTSSRICDNGVCKEGACGPGTKRCGLSCVPTIRQNGCSNTQSCSACIGTETCQGATNVCTCTPDNVTACKDQACGIATNNCGEDIVCPDRCGSTAPCAGTMCGCVPEPIGTTCAGVACGRAIGNCGQRVDCPSTCSPGFEQCGTVKPNECGPPSSCLTPGIGRSDCRGGSCCESVLVPGATFNRNRDSALPATISDFRLDKFPVTVGRFRAYVAASTNGFRPAAGSGKHRHLNGGQGLAIAGGGFEPGWLVTYNASIPLNISDWSNALGGQFATWTGSATGGDLRPIANASWYEAMAFCIWDGGFLPTYAEYNLATAGGTEQRDYPWGGTPPTPAYASYCQTSLPDGGPPPPCTQDPGNVGLHSPGDGRWGHADLVGGVWHWVADEAIASPFPSPCTNCLATGATDVLKVGGAVGSEELSLLNLYSRSSARNVRVHSSGSLAGATGFRCARVL